jgi:hypothetical protein
MTGCNLSQWRLVTASRRFHCGIGRCGFWQKPITAENDLLPQRSDCVSLALANDFGIRTLHTPRCLPFDRLEMRARMSQPLEGTLYVKGYEEARKYGAKGVFPGVTQFLVDGKRGCVSWLAGTGEPQYL